MKVRWYFLGLITLVANLVPERAEATLTPKCISTDSLPPAHEWLLPLPSKHPHPEIKQPSEWWKNLEFNLPETFPNERLAGQFPVKPYFWFGQKSTILGLGDWSTTELYVGN